MQRKHREAIQTNYTSLVERTDLDAVIARLYERNVFSAVMMERYRDTSVPERDRKRKLYMDITRRGPHAFENLLEVLSEVGNWDLVRMLDPNSGYQPMQNNVSSTRESAPRVTNNSFLSIGEQKSKFKSEMEKKNSGKLVRPQAPLTFASPPPPELGGAAAEYVPKYKVIKCTKSIEEDKDVESYPILDNRCGRLLIFSYVNFESDLEPVRNGVDVDNANLKHLFSEMGFKVMLSRNYTKDDRNHYETALETLTNRCGGGKYVYCHWFNRDTLNTLQSLKGLVGDADCVFVVVSSHGYQTDGSDTSVRCSDNRFISTYEIIEHFNNINLPELVGVPKVFIFQTCRGTSEDYAWWKRKCVAPLHMPMPPANVSVDCTAEQPAHNNNTAPTPLPPPTSQVHYDGRSITEKIPAYSDILIAHSTIPRYVAHRDNTDGSWYIQVLCEVFAERAHDCDVDKLFTLVDNRLQERFQMQVSSVDRWGFNKRLRLHPGRR